MQPYALGLMAQAVAASDRPAAVGLLEAAFHELEQQQPTRSGTTLHGKAQLAGALLPVVEDVEPDRLPEFTARAIALREPWLDGSSVAEHAEEIAQIAMMIARYDRELALHLLEPQVKQLAMVRGPAGSDFTSFRVLAALALIDPRRAVELAESLPDDPAPGLDENTPKNLARIQLAVLLAAHGKARWQQVYDSYLNLWTPGQRYL